MRVEHQVRAAGRRSQPLAERAPDPGDHAKDGPQTGRALAWHLISTVALVTVFLCFAIVHLRHWFSTGEPTGLGLVIEEALVAVLFLLRRRPTRVSGSPRDWLLAINGSWLILVVRPAGPPLLGLGWLSLGLQFAGLGVTLFSMSTLGRSFGIVAADRGLRTSGPYRIVRHPVYASYLLSQGGYVLQNPSAWNLAIVVTVTLCQIGRIHAEEAVLREDSAYRDYAQRVRFRLIPGVF